MATRDPDTILSKKIRHAFCITTLFLKKYFYYGTILYINQQKKSIFGGFLEYNNPVSLKQGHVETAKT
jgi:hypothetical protein